MREHRNYGALRKRGMRRVGGEIRGRNLHDG